MNAWEGIPEFRMVVETGGFTKAGNRLGVSASHVSRQVRRLEDRLGVKLLARTTRVVRLTDAGRAYHSRVSDLAAAIDEANQTAAGDQAELAGRIRVSAAGVFAEQLIAPVLAEFASQHPRIMIEMDFNTRFVDLIDQGFDFAIRYGVLAGSAIISRKLRSRMMVCAASPAYLEKRGVPTHPDELRRHACLITNRDRWLFTAPEDGAFFEVKVTGPWRANSGHALRAAALAGLGIAYAPALNLQPALEDGKLTRVLAGYEDHSRASWLVYPERRHMPLRVRRAIDFVTDAFSLT
jgi:DNA-binding transcriptional LysR family regulator